MKLPTDSEAIQLVLEFPIQTTSQLRRREHQIARSQSPVLLRSSQVATVLGLSTHDVYDLRRSGALVPVVKLGNCYYYHRRDVRKYRKQKAS